MAQVESADALCPVWGKLYRRDIIEDNGIVFTDIRKIGTYEDGLFNLEVFEHLHKVVYMQSIFIIIENIMIIQSHLNIKRNYLINGIICMI